MSVFLNVSPKFVYFTPRRDQTPGKTRNESTLTLALTTSRPTNHACLHRGDAFIWLLLPLVLFDLCRLEESHVTAAAALFALAAHPPVFAYATAAAVLALAALPPVLAEAAAATVLALAAISPVLAEATAAAVLAPAALPPVLALLLSHLHVRRARTEGPTFLHNSRARRRDARVQIFQHSASTWEINHGKGFSLVCGFTRCVRSL